MKNFFYACSILLCMFSACSKVENGCTNVAVDAEKGVMTTFANANNMSNAITHTSGLMYVIDNPGAGISINSNSVIFINYRGTLLDGQEFESATAIQTGFTLSGLIAGWQIGLPLVKKGGRIRLIIPSSLAYGCIERNKIPSNSPLYFDITVVDVQ